MNIILNIFKSLNNLIFRQQDRTTINDLSLLIQEGKKEIKDLKLIAKDIEAVEKFILDSRKVKIVVLFYAIAFCIIRYMEVLIVTNFY